MKNLIAVILGGGQGTRLYPLTKFRSKPAVPLGGKYRLIDIPISNCLNSGIRKIFVLTQFNSESLNRHIAQTYRMDMFSRGFVDILAAEQTFESRDWFQGTADAVRKCFRHFSSFNPSNILILSGDQLYKMDYSSFLEYHENTQADITIATIPVSLEHAAGFGIMKIGDWMEIVDFIEKPPANKLSEYRVDYDKIKGLPLDQRFVLSEKSYLASMGIYLFRTEILGELLKDNLFNDFGKDIIPSSIKRYNVFSYLYSGYWTDIGTIKSFYNANIDLTRSNPEFNLYDQSNPVYTHPRFLPASKIFKCHIHSSIIADGCILSGALIWNSIIGIRSRVGSGSEIRESLIMGADFYEELDDLNRNKDQGIPDLGIGNYCTIKKAIIDKNVRIGNNVKIINNNSFQEYESNMFVIKDGIVIIPKGITIPDNTVI